MKLTIFELNMYYIYRSQTTQLLQKLHRARVIEDIRGGKHNRADICDNNRLQVDTFISRTLSVLKSQHTETKIHGNQAKTHDTETKNILVKQKHMVLKQKHMILKQKKHITETKTHGRDAR